MKSVQTKLSRCSRLTFATEVDEEGGSIAIVILSGTNSASRKLSRFTASLS